MSTVPLPVPDPEVVGLVHALGDTTTWRWAWEGLAQTLTHHGRVSLTDVAVAPLLVEQLPGPEEDATRAILELLVVLGRDASTPEVAVVRRRVFRAMVPALAALLDDAAVAEVACAALTGCRGSVAAWQALAAFVPGLPPDRRPHGWLALGDQGHAEALPQLARVIARRETGNVERLAALLARLMVYERCGLWVDRVELRALHTWLSADAYALLWRGGPWGVWRPEPLALALGLWSGGGVVERLEPELACTCLAVMGHGGPARRLALRLVEMVSPGGLQDPDWTPATREVLGTIATRDDLWTDAQLYRMLLQRGITVPPRAGSWVDHARAVRDHVRERVA